MLGTNVMGTKDCFVGHSEFEVIESSILKRDMANVGRLICPS